MECLLKIIFSVSESLMHTFKIIIRPRVSKYFHKKLYLCNVHYMKLLVFWKIIQVKIKKEKKSKESLMSLKGIPEEIA